MPSLLLSKEMIMMKIIGKTHRESWTTIFLVLFPRSQNVKYAFQAYLR